MSDLPAADRRGRNPLVRSVRVLGPGLVTGGGLAAAIRRHYPRPFLYGACGLLLVMLISRNRAIMGTHANGSWLDLLGSSATVVMSLAALAFFVKPR